MRLYKILLLIGLSSFYASASIAQKAQDTKVKWIESGKLIEDGLKLAEDTKYDAAIEKFSQVPRSDTGYTKALASLADAWYSKQNYEKAIVFCKEGLARNTYYNASFYFTYISSLYDSEKYEECLKITEEGLKHYPMSQSMLYDRGLTLAKLHREPEAVQAYERVISLNPFYVAAHFELGRLCARNDQMTKAYLALQACILVEPSSKKALSALTILQAYGKGEYVPNKDSIVDLKMQDDDFSELDVILKSKLAFNADYKLKAKLNYPMLKQIQLLLEKLTYNKEDKGFFMQNYVPLFLSIRDNNFFEPYCFYLLSSQDNEDVQRGYKSRKSKIDKMLTDLGSQLFKQRELGPVAVDFSYAGITHYFDKGNRLESVGSLVTGTTDTRTGDWVYFSDDGRIVSKGKYDEKGWKTGAWVYYYANGNISNEENFKDDKPEGKQTAYYKSGHLESETQYVDGKLSGQSKFYYSAGQVARVTDYKDGKWDGPQVMYYMSGVKRAEMTGKDDELNGELHVYTNDGEKEHDAVFVNGKKNGPYKTYHSNRKVKEEGTYKVDQKTGEWKTYRRSGVVSDIETWKDNKLTGTSKDFYESGTTYREYTYDGEGKKTKVKFFSRTGEPFGEMTYKNDKLTNYRFYDKAGKTLSEGTEKKGVLALKAVQMDGTPIYEGNIKEGKSTGTWTYYTRDGIKDYDLKFNFKEEVSDRIEYFIDGSIAEEMHYVAGDLDGYYKLNFRNGKLRSEGFYKAGKKEGRWLTYKANGKLSEDEYYIHNERRGYETDYTVLGTPYLEYYGDENYIEKISYIDTTGKVYHVIDEKPGTMNFEEKFLNGKTSVKATKINCYFNGPYLTFFTNGKPCIKETTKFGYVEGAYERYFENGKLNSKGSYIHGDRHSQWTWFTEDGIKQSESNYEFDNLEGARTFYYPNGQKELTTAYVNNQKDGYADYYAPDGALRMRLKYEYGRLVAYTYLGKDGKMLPEIPVLAQSADIKAFFQNGNPSAEISFKNGQRIGSSKYYFTNGKIADESTWKNDEIEGVSKEYFLSGKLKAEENYFFGELDGMARYYNENGQLEKEIPYIFGEKHGMAKYYTLGKLSKTVKFVFNEAY